MYKWNVKCTSSRFHTRKSLLFWILINNVIGLTNPRGMPYIYQWFDFRFLCSFVLLSVFSCATHLWIGVGKSLSDSECINYQQKTPILHILLGVEINLLSEQ